MRFLGLVRAAVCYFACMHMPRASSECFPLMMALLPYAGDWAYRNDPGGRYYQEKAPGISTEG